MSLRGGRRWIEVFVIYWRDQRMRGRSTEGWERERQCEGERRRNMKRDEEGFRGNNNDKVTRG